MLITIGQGLTGTSQEIQSNFIVLFIFFLKLYSNTYFTFKLLHLGFYRHFTLRTFSASFISGIGCASY